VKEAYRTCQIQKGLEGKKVHRGERERDLCYRTQERVSTRVGGVEVPEYK